MWTPYEIKIVIHHAVTPEPFPGYAASVYWPSVNKLVELGLLTNGDDTPPKITELGLALLDQWRATPIPVVKYVDPRFEDA